MLFYVLLGMEKEMSLKQRLGFTKEPLYLMDGTAFLYRGFFANANMNRSDGLPTGAMYIVGRVLLKLLKEEQPTRFAFILDGPGKHFRHEMFPAYKANRPAAPDGLLAQVESSVWWRPWGCMWKCPRAARPTTASPV